MIKENKKFDENLPIGDPNLGPCFLPPKEQIEELLREFLELYEQRPIQDNQGGVKSVGSFSLWFFLTQVQPNLVIESGVWKGLTTWLIEKTLPKAEIICFDPLPEVRLYTSKNAIYIKSDFSKMDFSRHNLSKALVFFDDHQNAYKRVIESFNQGFKHLVFDDNYSPEVKSTHFSLQNCLSSGGKERKTLERLIKKYILFPPLFEYTGLITSERILIKVPALKIRDLPEFNILKNDMNTYRWMTYVQL